ncbi:2-polyprenylphenol 6-hydroxylase [Iodidimonas sp. SYSU 1G8]|uniref:2-polyprenylphenol 6-hydroxylase n=1 Tax=Iodidimonas sp. SYSU 1G8 TaxID=3133967 RepID=UPI0031FEADDD
MFGAVGHFLRLFKIARTLARHDAMFPLDLLAMPPALRTSLGVLTVFNRRQINAPIPPGERLARALEELGPTFIKLGQALATRPDIVNAEVAEALTRLQDRLPPFPGAEARAIIEDELGQPVEALFTQFDDNAVAAASIAQVHKAVTIDGLKVAVKVLRPGVREAFRRDLGTFFWFARLMESHVPDTRRLRPIKVAETFAEMVVLEMDLRYEAAAGSELRENMAGEHGFRIPRVHWPTTSERILTTEWIDGTPLGDRAALEALGIDMRALATVLVRVFLLQVMRDGFFHADLHQGNLFVDTDGNLVAVDFGIMGRLDRKSRRYLAEILRGFHTGDYRRIAEVHFEAGYVPRGKNVGTFAQALRAIGEPIAGRPVRDISFGKLLAQLFQITATFEMRTQPQLLLLQKTMVMAEGLAMYMDPEINMWEVSPPVVQAWLADNMGPDAYLRESAEAALSLLRSMPLIAEELERRADALTADGVRLHPESTRQIGETQGRFLQTQTLALWTIAALLLLLIMILD